MHLLNQIGLILNFIGSILVAIAFGNPPSTAHQWDKKGRKINLAAFLHPLAFKCGVGLLSLGFLLMLIATI